ncbi:LIM zinc-binding domain-containing Nebulette [Lates calcarifer]|uniref:LIM zinc-binding domain-containing Nebulette n=1 Tax=Lates calcarifer TaxID=8187 RepID=A0AAJ8DKZ4_LATCA|nr:LIM zinc-binding domain-containing Nebulette [Lates calcarifer]
MNPPCARCGKIVYPTEKVSCLDKNWHKGCFHCEVCKMTLNMKNYKGYDKKPYCNAHYPKTSFTIVADTPENLRLRQQSELQSQVKYKKDFEESKGRGFSIVSDTPEMQRLRKTQEQISNVCGHTHVVYIYICVCECVYVMCMRGCTLVSEHTHTHHHLRALQCCRHQPFEEELPPQPSV